MKQSLMYFLLILFFTFNITLYSYDEEAIRYYNLANENLAKKNLNTAISFFNKAIKKDKTMFEAHYLLGNIYYVKGKLDIAKQEYLKAISIKANHAPSNRYLGTLLLNNGKVKEALTYLDMAHTIEPKSKDILTEYATALFHDNQITQAKQLLEKNYDEDHYGINYLLHTIYIWNNDKEKAFYYLHLAYKIKPSKDVANKLITYNISQENYSQALDLLLSLEDKSNLNYEQIITIYLLEGKISKARSYFNSNKEKISNSSIKSHVNGNILFAEKKYPEALQEFLKIKQRKLYKDLDEKLGDIYFFENNKKKAKLYYKNALYYTPNNINLQKKYIRILFEEKQYKSALNVITKSLQKHNQDYELHLLAAKIYLERDRLPLAKYYCSQSLKINPDNAETHYIIGAIHYQMKYYDLAVTNFEKSLNLDEKNPSTYIYLGNAYERVKKFDLAVSNYQKALKFAPDNQEALLNLGQIYFKEKEFKEARPYLEKFISLNNKNHSAYYMLGKINMEEKNFDAAITNIKKAIELIPTDYIYPLTLAEIYNRMNKKEETIATLTKLIHKDVNNIEANLFLASIYKEQGEVEKAIIYYRNVTTTSASNIEARQNLILLYLSIFDHKKALFHLERLQAFNPEDHIILWAQAIISYRNNNFSNAIKIFNKSNFDSNQKNTYLGRCYFALKNYTDSANAFKQALKDNSNNLEARSFIALINYLNDNEDAYEQLNNIIGRKEKPYAEILNATANIEYKKNNFMRALSLATESLKMDPLLQANFFTNNLKSNTLFLLGNLYTKIKEYNKAIDFLQKITYPFLKEHYIEIQLLLANAYFSSDKKRNALIAWNKALSKNPNQVDALVGISKLFYLQRNYLKAIEFLQKAIAFSNNKSTNMEIYVLLGDVYIKINKTNQSINAYKSALEIENNNIELLLKLASANYLANKTDEAIDNLQTALDIDKNNLQALFLMGQSYLKQEKYQQASDYFEEVIDRDVENIEAYIHIIEILIHINKTDLAKKYLTHALKISAKKDINNKIKIRLNKIQQDLK